MVSPRRRAVLTFVRQSSSCNRIVLGSGLYVEPAHLVGSHFIGLVFTRWACNLVLDVVPAFGVLFSASYWLLWLVNPFRGITLNPSVGNLSLVGKVVVFDDPLAPFIGSLFLRTVSTLLDGALFSLARRPLFLVASSSASCWAPLWFAACCWCFVGPFSQ